MEEVDVFSVQMHQSISPFLFSRLCEKDVYEDSTGRSFSLSFPGEVSISKSLSACTSSSSDWTTGDSPPSLLAFWLSEDEVEEVEDTRDIPSQLLWMHRCSPRLTMPSWLLIP